ncbi:hypothetical protein [Actinomadura parmotrematis]|uniref:Uncharacterized protein n=1 Tax=Actinomadura parmotrematis TaxID=2864039 RepID=A0ABS7G486_9ACTN|nr:hypothetical protein [Actinomadura parmotrematis]MBW8487517.1 hypothetical protein [Actinomadura parmotrematis]
MTADEYESLQDRGAGTGHDRWTVSVDYDLDAGKANGVAIRVALVE